MNKNDIVKFSSHVNYLEKYLTFSMIQFIQVM